MPLPKSHYNQKPKLRVKKKKTTRSLPHPTHLNPKDKNQSMPHCKTNTKPTQIGETTKPRSAKPFDPQCHQINVATNAANITPHLAHHQWSWVTHHRWHWQPTNLHRETHQFLSIQNPKSTPISMPWPQTKPNSSTSFEQEREMWDKRNSEDCVRDELWERERVNEKCWEWEKEK